MAYHDQLTIDQIGTLVFEIQHEDISTVVNRFQGRKTPRTLAAARRIRAKKQQIKLPRNLMRQLFRLTGGWYAETLKPGWDGKTPQPNWPTVRIGDLRVAFQPVDQNENFELALVEYRGRKVARFSSGYRHYNWLVNATVKGAVASLGQPWSK